MGVGVVGVVVGVVVVLVLVVILIEVLVVVTVVDKVSLLLLFDNISNLRTFRSQYLLRHFATDNSVLVSATTVPYI